MLSTLTWLTFSTIFWTIEHILSDLSAAICSGASTTLVARPLADAAIVSSAGTGLLPAHPIAVLRAVRRGAPGRCRRSSLVRSWTSSANLSTLIQCNTHKVYVYMYINTCSVNLFMNLKIYVAWNDEKRMYARVLTINNASTLLPLPLVERAGQRSLFPYTRVGNVWRTRHTRTGEGGV